MELQNKNLQKNSEMLTLLKTIVNFKVICLQQEFLCSEKLAEAN